MNRITSKLRPSRKRTENMSNLPDVHARVVATQIGERAAAAASMNENRTCQMRSPERLVLKIYIFCKVDDGKRMPVTNATLEVRTK